MVLLSSLVYEEPPVSWREELWKAIKGDDAKELLRWGATLGLGGLIGKYLYDKYQGTSLAILGMAEAGKTQFWKNLKGEQYSAYETTMAEQQYKPFDYRYGNRTFRVGAGKDIGGADENFKAYWEQMLSEYKIVLFIFDASKYLKDESYQLLTNARLDFLCEKRNKLKDRKEKKFAVIASHADQVDRVDLGEKADLVACLQTLVKGQPYAPLFYQNFWPCNLTDPTDFRTITEKLFANV